MLSNKVAVGLISAVTLAGAAAGAGAYLASRHPAEVAKTVAPPTAVTASPRPAAGAPVEVTEAVMDDDKDAVEAKSPAIEPPAAGPASPAPAVSAPKLHHVDPPAPVAAPKPAPSQTSTQPVVSTPQPQDNIRSAQAAPVSPQSIPPAPPSMQAHPVEPERANGRPERPQQVERPQAESAASETPGTQLLEVTVPPDSVIGLQFETAISSETARIEDRVVARVTRDVRAEGRVAIPAGSKVLGSVSLVDRGGRMKDQSRLGVRFHTVILVDGTELPLQTETIYREGESPANASAAKVGGGAIGGAILGAILGGGKGAAIGGALGAAGGSAAVMTGGRKPAQFTSGSPVTVKVLSPVTVTVERE